MQKQEESPHLETAAIVIEYYKKVGDKVYYVWKFLDDREGTDVWHHKLTPYTDLPVITFKPGELFT